MYEELYGRSTGFQKMEYNWRDMALYALGVGAERDDLQYTYEKDMKAIPTFGTLPCFSALYSEPRRPNTYPGVFLVRDEIARRTGKTANCMHLSAEFIYHRPLDPIKGTLIYEERVQKVYDWGERGVIVETVLPVYDEAGRLICETVNRSACYGGGNFGGEKLAAAKPVYPERDPDAELSGYMSPVQNVLYRLSGDTHPAHVDPETAKAYGMQGAFMHGLCTYGYACRMAVKSLMGNAPERFRRMNAQLRSVVYPDTEIRFLAWKTGEQEAVFRLVNAADGKAVLDQGTVSWA